MKQNLQFISETKPKDQRKTQNTDRIQEKKYANGAEAKRTYAFW